MSPSSGSGGEGGGDDTVCDRLDAAADVACGAGGFALWPSATFAAAALAVAGAFEADTSLCICSTSARTSGMSYWADEPRPTCVTGDARGAEGAADTDDAGSAAEVGLADGTGRSGSADAMEVATGRAVSSVEPASSRKENKQGPQGPQGVQGPQGPQGPQGVDPLACQGLVQLRPVVVSAHLSWGQSR